MTYHKIQDKIMSNVEWDEFNAINYHAALVKEVTSQDLITQVCEEVNNLLLDKNRKYGDSALNPKRLFSKANPLEQINIRIDDKLSRLESSQGDDLEDVELDLIGYLILKRVYRLKHGR